MTDLLSLPWLEASVLVPLLGALVVSRFAEPAQTLRWGVAFAGLERLVAVVVRVVHGGDHAGAGDFESHGVARVGNRHAVFIGDGRAHVAHVVPIGARRPSFSSAADSS